MTTTAREYGWAHQQLRARWAPIVDTGTITCPRLQRWDLGHNDVDRSQCAGPEHARCNRRRRRRRWQPTTTTLADHRHHDPRGPAATDRLPLVTSAHQLPRSSRSASAGDWAINANGWHGTLHLQDDGDGSVSGTIQIEAGRAREGVWDESAQQLIFVRNNGAQNYTGYWFENTGNMSMGQGAPSGTPNFRVLAGDFDDVRSTHPFGRARFGWAARQAIP